MQSKSIYCKAIGCLFFVCSVLLFLVSCTTTRSVFNKIYFWDDAHNTHVKFTHKDMNTFVSSVREPLGNPDSHYWLAHYYQDRERHKEAIKEFKKIIEIDPGFVKAYNGIGVSFDTLGYSYRAIDYYKKALSVNPDLDYVTNNLGYSYIRLGNYDQAIDALKKSVELNKDNKRFHNNLGLAYARKGYYELAFNEFKQAGSEARAHYNIGRIYYRNGLFAEAKAHFQEALNINPSFLVAKGWLDAAGSIEMTNQSSVKMTTGDDNIDFIQSERERVVRKTSTDADNWDKNTVSAEKSGLTGQEKPAPSASLSENLIKPGRKEYIQVGSWINHTYARKKLKDIKKSYPNVYIAEQDNFRKIRIPNIINKEEGAHVITRIKEDFNLEPLLVLKTEADYRSSYKNQENTLLMTDDKSSTIEKEKSSLNNNLDAYIPENHHIRVGIEVSNGNGVSSMARNVGEYLSGKGFDVIRLTDADNFNHAETVVYFQDGYLKNAYEVVEQIMGHQDMGKVRNRKFDESDINIKVVIGKDLAGYNNIFAGG